jgi:hypothetical protein
MSVRQNASIGDRAMLRCNIMLQRNILAVVDHPARRIYAGLEMLPDTDRSAATLRALASWYRQYAELASNPAIWSSRLSTAEELERQASAAERSAFPQLKI